MAKLKRKKPRELASGGKKISKQQPCLETRFSNTSAHASAFRKAEKSSTRRTGEPTAGTASHAHLSQHEERLDDVPLHLQLELDELLRQLVLRLPAQPQHLPARHARLGQGCAGDSSATGTRRRQHLLPQQGVIAQHGRALRQALRQRRQRQLLLQRERGAVRPCAPQAARASGTAQTCAPDCRAHRALVGIHALLALQARRQLLVGAVGHLLHQLQTLLHLWAQRWPSPPCPVLWGSSNQREFG